MGYGLKTWDNNGRLTVDAPSRLSRIVYETRVSRGASGSVSISLPPGGAEPIAILDQEPEYLVVAHELDLASDGTLTYSLASDSDLKTGPTRILVVSIG